VQSFQQQIEHVQQHKPRKQLGRRYMVRAAVTLIIREYEDGPKVLMMRRADRKGDPWSGHMAFPGGKTDPHDPSTFGTALRELQEETGIEPIAALQPVGRLSDVLTRPHSGRRPMVVTPFVFTVDQDLYFDSNHEVAELLWVPLQFIANASHREKMNWNAAGVDLTLPCYFYNGRRIWGLSLTMLDELVKIMYHQTFADTHHRRQFVPGTKALWRMMTSKR
jgi:8-oxo-dGTP pyrophosphatase MutT (NUDIX family)